MTRSKQSSQKREKEKGKQKKRLEKEERRQERKKHSTRGLGIDAIEVAATIQENSAVVPDNLITVAPDNTDDVKIGKIVYLNEQKNYGFIRDARIKENVFFSITDLQCKVKLNDLVTFIRIKGTRGSTATAIE